MAKALRLRLSRLRMALRVALGADLGVDEGRELRETRGGIFGKDAEGVAVVGTKQWEECREMSMMET